MKIFTKFLPILILILTFVVNSTVSQDSPPNTNDSESQDFLAELETKIQVLINMMLEDRTDFYDSARAKLHKFYNRYPEKCQLIFNKLKKNSQMLIQREFSSIARYYNVYKNWQSSTQKIAKIVNIDFTKAFRVLIQEKQQSSEGWWFAANSDTKDTEFVKDDLSFEIIAKKNKRSPFLQIKLINWQAVFEDQAMKALGSRSYNEISVVYRFCIWAIAAMQKQEYILSGLLIKASAKVYQRFNAETAEDPNEVTEQELENKLKNNLRQYFILRKHNQIIAKYADDQKLQKLHDSLAKLLENSSDKDHRSQHAKTQLAEVNKTLQFLKLEHLTANQQFIKKILEAKFVNQSHDEIYAKLEYNAENSDIKAIWNELVSYLPEKLDELENIIKTRFLTKFVLPFDKPHILSTGEVVLFMLLKVIGENPAEYLTYFINGQNQTVFDKINQKFAQMPTKPTEFFKTLAAAKNTSNIFAFEQLMKLDVAEAQNFLISIIHKNDLEQFRFLSCFIKFAETSDQNYKNYIEGLLTKTKNIQLIHILAEYLWNKHNSKTGAELILNFLKNLTSKQQVNSQILRTYFLFLMKISAVDTDFNIKFQQILLRCLDSKNIALRYSALVVLGNEENLPESFKEKIETLILDDSVLFEFANASEFPLLVSDRALQIYNKINSFDDAIKPENNLFDRKLTLATLLRIEDKNQIAEKLNKFIFSDVEKVNPEAVKDIVDNFLNAKTEAEIKVYEGQVVKTPGCWDVLRVSGRGKTKAQIERIKKVAGLISLKMKTFAIHAQSQDINAKLMKLTDKFKNESLDLSELPLVLAQNAGMLKLSEVAFYAAKLGDGKGTKVFVSTNESDAKNPQATNSKFIYSIRYQKKIIAEMSANLFVPIVDDPEKLQLNPQLLSELQALQEFNHKHLTKKFELYFHLKALN